MQIMATIWSPKSRFSSENVEKTFDTKATLFRVEKAKPWIFINVFLTTLLAADVSFGQILVYLFVPKVYIDIGSLTEKVLLVLFCVNSLTLIILTLKPFLFVSPISLTNRQMKLLGVNDKSRFFKKFDQTKQVSDKVSPVALDLSWIFRVKTTKTNANSSSVSSNNKSFYQTSLNESFSLNNTTQQLINNESYTDALLRLRRAKSCSPFVSSPSPTENIKTSYQLRQYLTKFDSSYVDRGPVEDYLNLSQNSTVFNDSYSAQTSKFVDFSHLVGQKYQISPNISVEDTVEAFSSQIPGVSSKTVEHSSFSPVQLQIWLKFDLNPENIDLLTHNIRVWISSTIFRPIVREIEIINQQLLAQHRADLLVGSSSLISLQQLTSTYAKQFPKLAVLLPYLELTTDQNFLVSKIKELNRGSCLAKFNLSTTSNQTVSDFDIVLHFLCVYLNSKMPSNPVNTAGTEVGPFTSRYFVKYPAKPNQGRRYLAIYRPSPALPHLQVVYENDVYDVGKGVNNLFRTFLLFVQILNLHFDARLGSLSLSPSGLNLLWTLECLD